jgi:nicotinamidase-related amidase
MPIDIGPLTEPASTALLTVELQQNMVGEPAEGPLAESARRILPNVVRLADSARRVGVPVAHCLKVFRRDSLGRNTNLALYKRRGIPPSGPVSADPRPQEGTEVVAELGPDPRDLVFTRLHGMGAVFDGGVDPVLRTLGVSSVVVVGISANVGIPNTVMDLANRSYEVIVPADAIAGTPDDYTEAMVENTIKMLATVTTTDALVERWEGA